MALFIGPYPHMPLGLLPVMQDENGNNILTFGGLIPVCTYIKLCFPYRQTVLVQILKTKTHHIKMSLAIIK